MNIYIYAGLNILGYTVSYSTFRKLDLRQNIILSLLDGEKKIAELEKATQTRATTILHILKETEQMELTTKKNGVYKLTSIGVIEAQICKAGYQAFNVLKKHKDFWLTHDVSVIPQSLMMTLGDIENAVIVKSTDVDLNKVHENFIQLLISSEVIRGASPILHPDYIKVVGEKLKQGHKVDLIVTTSVLEKIKETNSELIDKYTVEGNLQVFLNDDLKLALTVTENCWSLGLFNLSGEYDYSNDLICSEEAGLEWGQQLFKKALEKSVKM
jgi:predicted transcriptional regulator